MTAYRLRLAALACAMVTTGAALAQTSKDTGDRTVEQYACKDVMRESGGNRDVAIAFLHGFLLGKSGGSGFNVETLRKTDRRLHRALSGQSGAQGDRCDDRGEEIGRAIRCGISAKLRRPLFFSRRGRARSPNLAFPPSGNPRARGTPGFQPSPWPHARVSKAHEQSSPRTAERIRRSARGV
jgi:hypothetical protein